MGVFFAIKVAIASFALVRTNAMIPPDSYALVSDLVKGAKCNTPGSSYGNCSIIRANGTDMLRFVVLKLGTSPFSIDMHVQNDRNVTAGDIGLM